MRAIRLFSFSVRRYAPAFLALLLWLGVTSFYLLYLTQPLTLVLELESGDPSDLQVTTTSSGADAALYRQNKTNGQVRKNDSGIVIEFPLAFEYFDAWRLAARRADTLHIKSLALKSMFGSAHWAPEELAQSVLPSDTSIHLELQDNAFVVRADKPGTVLSGTPDRSALAAVHTVPPWLAAAALAALLLTCWVLLENPLRAWAAWRSSRMRFRPRLSTILMWLLLGYGIFRLLALVTATPLMGYANTGDFGRILSCFGLEPAAPHLPASQAYPDAPIALFRANGSVDHNYCYLTSEIWFVRLALTFAGAPVSIQTLGVVQALALSAAGIGLTLLYKRLSIQAALISAGIFALLAADPMNGLFLNTFFSEFAAFLCAYVSAALLLCMILTQTWEPGLLLLFCLALYGLGIAKVQMWLFPFLLAAFFIVVSLLRMRKQVRRSELVLGMGMLAATLLVVSGLQSYQRERPAYIQATRLANAMDLYFITLLPNTQDPQGALALLGLPPSCAQYIGISFYDIGGGKNMQCREIENVAPARALLLLAREPRLFWLLGLDSLIHSRPWLVEYVGWVGKGSDAPIDMQFPQPFWSIAIYIQALPQTVYLLMYLILGTGALLALGILAGTRQHALSGRLGQIAIFVLLMSLVVLYALASAFFGAGLNDFAKHAYLAQLALCLGAAGAAVEIMMLGRYFTRSGSRNSGTDNDTKARLE